MATENETNEIQNPLDPPSLKAKRAYHRRQSPPIQTSAPNPNIMALESDLIPLVNQRLDANRKVLIATQKANQANFDLENARNELQQIESEINYRMQIIGQIKNGGMPVPQTPYIAQALSQPQSGYSNQLPNYSNQQSGYGPNFVPSSPPYAPVIPYPAQPASVPGVGSMPANNIGLYPDVAPRGFVETDPERMVNTEDHYQFPPEVTNRINEGRR